MLGIVPDIDPAIVSLIIVPTFIFFARICDVTIGTMRIIFVARGMKMVAPILGFVEVFIWIIAIGQIFQNLTNPLNYFAYAAGFGTETTSGCSSRSGWRWGSPHPDHHPAGRNQSHRLPPCRRLRVTVIDAQGKQGPGKVIFSVIKRKNIKDVENAIHEFAPKAFYSVEDIRRAAEGTFPIAPSPTPFRLNRGTRRGK